MPIPGTHTSRNSCIPTAPLHAVKELPVFQCWKVSCACFPGRTFSRWGAMPRRRWRSSPWRRGHCGIRPWVGQLNLHASCGPRSDATDQGQWRQSICGARRITSGVPGLQLATGGRALCILRAAHLLAHASSQRDAAHWRRACAGHAGQVRRDLLGEHFRQAVGLRLAPVKGHAKVGTAGATVLAGIVAGRCVGHAVTGAGPTIVAAIICFISMNCDV